MVTILSIPLIAFVTVVPVLLLALLIWWADRYEREPSFLILVSFLWGALPAVLLSLLAWNLAWPDNGEWSNTFANTCLHAPFVEEFFKALAVAGIFFTCRRQFDGPLDGLIYGSMIGFGFSMTENFIYYLSTLEKSGLLATLPVVISRGILFAFGHSFFTGFTGLGFGLAAQTKNPWIRTGWPILGYGCAVFSHSLHNFGSTMTLLLFSEHFPGLGLLSFGTTVLFALLGIGLIAVVLRLAWNHEKSVIRAQLQEEVGELLSLQEYSHLCDRWFQPLSCQHPQTLRKRRLVQLALRKYRQNHQPPRHYQSFALATDRLREDLRSEYWTQIKSTPQN